jgi:hypothetical protein
MVPASNFYASARLVTIISFFKYMRLALPDIAQELQDAIKVARTKLEKPLILAYLVDLRDLLFYAIPVVGCPKSCCECEW